MFVQFFVIEQCLATDWGKLLKPLSARQQKEDSRTILLKSGKKIKEILCMWRYKEIKVI